jgi:glutathione S-transferase
MLLLFVWTGFVTLLAVILCMVLTLRVARARARYGVLAPATDGPPEFARALRVQQNTLEQLVMFLPALWLFALSIGDRWAALIGAVWLLGRILYAVAYDRAPEKRIAGFVITVAATIVLIIGAAFGLVMLAMLWMVD